MPRTSVKAAMLRLRRALEPSRRRYKLLFSRRHCGYLLPAEVRSAS